MSQGRTHSGKISEMILNFAWEAAIQQLRLMRAAKERPKLGALQRWVRECDAAGTNDPAALRVLDGILRTSTPELVRDGPEGVPGVRDANGVILRFPQFEAIRGTLSAPQRALEMGVSESP